MISGLHSQGSTEHIPSVGFIFVLPVIGQDISLTYIMQEFGVS